MTTFQYHRQHKDQEYNGLDLVVNAMESLNPSIPGNVKYTTPTRTQSSTLENRYIGQARNIVSHQSVEGISTLADTELGRIPSLKGKKKHFCTTLTHLMIVAKDHHTVFILDEVLKHVSEPERYFFISLDQDLETISVFYDCKEQKKRVAR